MKTVNKVRNSYTYYLEPNLRQIYWMSVMKQVRIDWMKKFIYNYIYDATTYYTDDYGKKVPTKKVEFLNKINNMKSKKEIYWYCRNSVNKARKTIVTHK